MKTLRSVLKGSLVGCIVAIITLLTIDSVRAYTNPARHLSIPERPVQALTINSSPDDVLALMLDSDQMWDTLEAEYQLTDFHSITGMSIKETQRFWLANRGEWARMEIDGENPSTFVRNATSIYRENRAKNIYSQEKIPGSVKYEEFNPREALRNNSNTIILHPFGKALPTGYYDFLFPTGIAQCLIINQATGLEDVKIIGEEIIAGRKAIIISRMPKNHLYWVDAQTGIILRAQFIGEAEHWQIQFEIQRIVFGEKIPESTFQFIPSKGVRRVTLSEYQSQDK